MKFKNNNIFWKHVLFLFLITSGVCNSIFSQGDFHHLLEPVDTFDLFKPQKQHQARSVDSINSNRRNNSVKDTTKYLLPEDTIDKKEEPLSAIDAFFPSKMALEDMTKTNEALKRNNTEIRSTRLVEEHTFLFYLIAFIIFLYALIRIRFLPYIDNILRSFKSIRAARIQFEETSYRDTLPKYLLLVNTVFVFSLVVYWFGSRFFGNTDSPMLFWGGCFFIFMLIFSLRLFFIKASAWVFPLTETIEYYLFNVQLINVVTAWVLLPVMVLAIFNNQVSVSIMAGIILVIWLILVLFRLYRGYEITQEVMVKYPFYFFIYLCTLEISPMLVLYKLFVKF